MNSTEYTEVISSNPYLVVDWLLGNTCNYDCPYCNQTLKDGSASWPELSDAVKFLDRLQTSGRPVSLILSGGEPTLWKHLPEFLTEARSRDIVTKLITNGFRKPHYWASLSPSLDSVVFSLHVPQISNIEAFIENFNSVTVDDKTILLLAWPQSWPTVIDYHTACKIGMKGGSLQVKPVDERWEGRGGLISYDSEQKAWLEKTKIYRPTGTVTRYHPSYLRSSAGDEEIGAWTILSRKNSFLGWSCNIGIEKLTIDQYGDIWRGTCGIGGKIGRYTDQDIILPKDAIACNIQYCNCMPDLMTSKKKIV